MKLYIKQKVFSLINRFHVYDEAGKERYYVEGEFPALLHRLHIYDANGSEKAIVRGKFSFLPRYGVEILGTEVAEICKEFTFFRPSFYIEGKNWQVDGDFFGHDYTISESGRTVAVIRKEWFTWGDSYELDIRHDADEVTALAMILAIDCVISDSNAAAASGS